MTTTEDLRGMSASQLMDVFRQGAPFDVENILDAEYLGVSLGLPPLALKLSWTTFMKVFLREDEGMRGWNVRLEQTGIGGPVRLLRRWLTPPFFGPFEIRAMSATEKLAHPPATVMLDYGAYKQPPPMSVMRDPLVSLDGGVGERLLGFSYAELGPARIPTPSFFLLERFGPIEFEIPDPAPRRNTDG